MSQVKILFKKNGENIYTEADREQRGIFPEGKIMPATATCRGCGCAFQTTTEDAGVPDNQAGPLDRICLDCYRANRKGYDQQGRRIE